MAAHPRSVIIGAGVIGLACAHALCQRGHRVTVVERGTIGGGCSFGNAGWIVPSFSAPIPAPGLPARSLGWMLRPDSPFRLSLRAAPRLAGWLRQFRRHCNARDFAGGMQALAELNRTTMHRFDALAADGVRFEMHHRGVLFAFLDERELRATGLRLEALAEQGFGRPIALRGPALRSAQPGLSREVRGGLLVEGERHVRPDSLVAGLAAWLRASGVELKEGLEVLDWQTRDRRITGLRTSQGPIAGDHFVLAAGAHSGLLAARLGLHLPIQSGKGYSLTFDSPSPLRQPLDLAEAGVVCTPFLEGWRIAGTMELSGIDGAPDPRRFETLRRATRRYLELPEEAIAHGRTWMGQRPLTPDGLPAIGPMPGYANGYVATGHAMLGLTLAPATAQMVADWITRGGSELPTRAFLPARFLRPHAAHAT